MSNDGSETNDPWTRHARLAWWAAADRANAPTFPPPPATMSPGRHWSTFDEHMDVIAWWSPLHHLTTAALGWQNPGKGLFEWMKAGRSVEDPVLWVIDRWYGRYVELYAAWADPSRAEAQVLRQTDRYRAAMGSDFDSHHLGGGPHGVVGAVGDPGDVLAARYEDHPTVHGAAVSTSYRGWYRALNPVAASVAGPGQHPYIDVFVRPIGWMGTFRRSRVSGRWFRGRHRWHQLGIDPTFDGHAGT